MLKKLIERFKEKAEERKRNKPEYRIGNLYVGEIVLYKNSEYIGYCTYNHTYKPIKKYAILIERSYGKYKHVKSGQILTEMSCYDSTPGDYAVHNIRKFEKASPIYMRKNKLTPLTKVSRAFIEDFENSINESLDPNQKVDELFI